jgi:hypothetical protein
MPYGYLGQNTPNQTKSNSGVFSISDVADLEKQGKFGGSLELIEEKSISASSSAIFTDIKETKYDVHYLTVENFAPSVDTIQCEIRFFENGVEESASVYQDALQIGRATGTFQEVRSTARNSIRDMATIGNATNEIGNSYTYFYNLGNSSKYSFCTFHNTTIDETGAYRFGFGGGVLPQASLVDQIKIFVTSGTFSATAKLYGVKQL